MSAPPAAPQASPARGLLTRVALPTAAAALVALLVGSFLGAFMAQPRSLHLSLLAAWVLYGTGRGLLHWDVPKGSGAALQRVATGGALGLVGLGILLAFFEDGPGWPYTPLWALALGLGSGIWRAHKPLLANARAETPRGRLWGLFDRRELMALGVLLAGYALAGFALWRLFLAFAGLIPEAGKALTLGIALYALHGARLLLAFASEEAHAPGRGFVAWFKANLLRNAIVVVVLGAYAVYRDDLSRSLPFFPFLEFGLGVAVFGFLAARLRSRFAREATERATASDARAHQQKVQTLAEPEYEAVASPVARFVETGRAQREYAEMLRAATGLPASPDEPVLAPLAAHREPPPSPVLPLDAALAARVLVAFLVSAGVVAFFVQVAEADLADVAPVGFLLFGAGVYAAQGEARARMRPWAGLGVAGAGVALVAGTLLWLFGMPPLTVAMSVFLLLALGAALGIPALLSWRLDEALRRGTHVPPAREPAAVELDKGLRAARRRAAYAAVAFLILTFLVPPLIRWPAERGWGLEGFPEFYGRFLGPVLWGLAALGGDGLLRFAALRRVRPLVLAEEKRRRDARLTLHKDLMRRLERV